MKTIKYVLCIAVICMAYQNWAQNWLRDFEQACTMAKSQNKLVLVDFYADWCGPCKTMDRETWANQDVVKEMSKVVAIKIDIDVNKALAMNYGVKGIPYVVVIDAWGNKLYDIVGMQSASKITSLLSGLPDNTEEIYVALEKLESDPESAGLNFELGVSYQEISKNLSEEGKNIFVRNSYVYLNRAKKTYKKQKDDVKIEEVELMRCCNNIILGRGKSAVNAIEKMGVDKIKPQNKALACFVAAQAYVDQGMLVEAKEVAKKLENESSESSYVAQLKKSNPELFEE